MRTANIGNVASVPQQIVGHYLGGLVFWAKLVTPLWPEHRNRRGVTRYHRMKDNYVKERVD